jgi:hypothetical protein
MKSDHAKKNKTKKKKKEPVQALLWVGVRARVRVRGRGRVRLGLGLVDRHSLVIKQLAGVAKDVIVVSGDFENEK